MSYIPRENETQDESIRGVTVGIVTDNKDPKEMGRVKLTFPWRDAEDESYWARIATLMSGAEMGTYFLPEQGDEVLVAFDGGDISYPYVVGSLWNGKEIPPLDNTDGKNNVREIKSRSGHEIVLDDTAGEERVEISTGGGQTITLDDASSAETVAIEDTEGNRVSFDSEGNVAVVGNAKVSVEAETLELTGTGGVTISSSGPLTIDGATVEIK